MKYLHIANFLLLVANIFCCCWIFPSGSFAHNPAYAPFEISCVASDTIIPVTMTTPTNDHIPVKTPLPTTKQNTGGHDDNDNDNNDDNDDLAMGTGVGSGFILLVILVAVIVTTVVCFIKLALVIKHLKVPNV